MVSENFVQLSVVSRQVQPEIQGPKCYINNARLHYEKKVDKYPMSKYWCYKI